MGAHMKHCQVEVQESNFGYHFQTIRELANNNFQFHREVIYSMDQYILTKYVFSPCTFFLH